MPLPIRSDYHGEMKKSIGLVYRVSIIVAGVLSMLRPSMIERLLRTGSRNTLKADPKQVLEWKNSIENISMRCHGNGCLIKSLSIMIVGILLRQTPVWCTGIITRPFLSHAWVEIDGKPIGEDLGVGQYKRIMVVQPEWKELEHD